MLLASHFLKTLRSACVDFFTGVPDSLLKDFCSQVSDSLPETAHVIAANEGAALALAAGWQMATRGLPLVYLQNSGLGNLVNPLTSLVDPKVYAIPTLLLIGWRGEPGVPDEPQHIQQGAVTPALLSSLEIPWFILPKESSHADLCVQNAAQLAKSRSGPVALLVQKDTFEKYRLQSVTPNHYPLTREAAIQQILPCLPANGALISTTGMISREVYENRLLGGGLQADFLTVGCMGHASQIAYGVALAKPEKPVCCLDGDGALLMHLGSLAVLGARKPANFLHIVLNNGAHDSVGGQDTVAFQIDLPAMALACGYRSACQISDAQEIAPLLAGLTTPGPHFVEIRVCRGSRSDLGRPKSSPLENKHNFIAHL